MTNKTELWDRLGKTDPSHTKQFQRAGGFKGTAIKPMWSYRRMTEEYGPCGVGWGLGEPTFKIIEAADEILVYCIASVWHGSKENVVYGVGGDKALAKFSSGMKTDDEALKKAFTDGVTNALKMIGVGADVHMGLFEDSKYVSEMKAEYAQKNTQDGYLDDGETIPAEHLITRDDNIQVLTMDAQRPIFSELERELLNCKTVEALKRWKGSAHTRKRASRLSDHWKDDLNKRYLTYLRSLEKSEADEYIERATANG
jgi:hypothetical protein